MEYIKTWQMANPGKVSKYQHEASRRRRALKFNAPGSFTEQEWAVLKARFNYHCVKCGAPVSPDNPFHRDHIRPLSRGGSDYIQNIQPLCARCHYPKGNRETISHRPDQTQLPLF